MDFAAVVRNRQICMSPQMLAMRDDYIGRMREGTPLIVTIKRPDHSKTHAQVKCHWGLVVAIVKREFDERGTDLATFMRSKDIPAGLPVPVDVIQSVLYATCGDVGDNGERKTLSRMNTIEASRFFDKCCNYIASAWGIVVPLPDKDWRQTQEKHRKLREG